MTPDLLLDNVCYLERLLSAMEQRITRMTNLSNSIKEEEGYYILYTMPRNIFELPASLRFHPLLKCLLISLVLAIFVGSILGAVYCATVCFIWFFFVPVSVFGRWYEKKKKKKKRKSLLENSLSGTLSSGWPSFRPSMLQRPTTS